MEGNIEFYILILASRSETFLLKIGEYLYTDDVKELTKRSYFDNRHCQTILNLCYYVYTKTNRLATVRDIEFLITRLFQNEEQKRDILNVAHDVYWFSDEMNFELVEEEAIKFVKEKKFLEALTQAQKDLESKNYESAIEKLQKSTQVSFDKDYGVDIKDWDSVKTAITEVNDTSEAISTGYDLLDSEQVLNGGFRRKEEFVVAANSGVGKTMFLGNLAVNAALNGNNVLYLSMETSAARLASRMMANLINRSTANISYNISESPDDIKADWEQNVKDMPGDLRIKEFATNSMDSNQIEAFILDLNKNTGFKPDLVVVDYLSICVPNDHRLSRENTYTYSKAIAEDLRAMAYRLNCVLLTGAQVNRDGLKDGATKSIITTEDLADSLGIEFTADFILTLSQDNNFKKREQLRAYVAKNRNNTKGQSMILQQTDVCRLVELKEQASNTLRLVEN